MLVKKNNKKAIVLGVFVSIGVLLLTVGIYFVGKKQQLFNDTFKISGIFKDISGLQVGNNVRFSGINVGVIENIEIVTDTSVKVDFIVDVGVKKFIKEDSKAVIGNDGLMGNKIVSILPGSVGSREVSEDAIIATITPVSFDDILLDLKVTSNNSAQITEDLSVIIHRIKSGKGTIGKLFMDTVFAGNIDKSIVNIKKGTAGFNKNMDAASKSFLLRGLLKKKDDKKK
ncbi:MAG: MlaD family protein [bacterium]|nr:MlaD family protein [bacterium]